MNYGLVDRRWRNLAVAILAAVLLAGDSNTKVTLDPLGNIGALSAGKKYRVIITTGAKDPAASPLASNFSWIFNTAR